MKVLSVKPIRPQPLSVDALILSDEPKERAPDAGKFELQGPAESYALAVGMPSSIEKGTVHYVSAVWQAPRVADVTFSGNRGHVRLAWHGAPAGQAPQDAALAREA